MNPLDSAQTGSEARDMGVQLLKLQRKLVLFIKNNLVVLGRLCLESQNDWTSFGQ